MIEMIGIHKSFRTGRVVLPVLQGIDMVVEDKKIVALVGKSGSGKSTIAKIMCGIIAPDAGELYFCGQKVCDFRRYDPTYYGFIQMIPQFPSLSLDPKQTVESAISEQLLIHKIVKDPKEVLAKTYELMEKVGLSFALGKRKPIALSGGEAQRVVIARALTLNPKLLIADESTSMLDIATQAEIIALYRYLVMEKNMSMLFISHDEELVNAISDKIYLLENGCLKNN